MNAMQYFQEFHVFAADVIEETNEKTQMFPTVVCHHCRVAITDINPDGSRICGPWLRCSSCSHGCGAMRTQCWGARAEVVKEPLIEDTGVCVSLL